MKTKPGHTPVRVDVPDGAMNAVVRLAISRGVSRGEVVADALRYYLLAVGFHPDAIDPPPGHADAQS